MDKSKKINKLIVSSNYLDSNDDIPGVGAFLPAEVFSPNWCKLINKSHQITHVCVPHISSNCITEDFIKEIKDLTGINITILPFNPKLFKKIHENWSDINYLYHHDIKDGLYILLDSNNDFDIMKYIYMIQRKINISIKHYKKINNIKEPDSWTLHYLSDKRHKWVGR